MALTYLALGDPNDGLGTPLRSGGQIINDNFDFVNPRQFGLGESNPTPYAGSADTLTTKSFYYMASAWVGSPYAGTNANNQGYLEVSATNVSNYAGQTFKSLTNGAVFERLLVAGTWSDWKRIDPQAFGLGDDTTSPLENDIGAIPSSGFSHADSSAINAPIGSTIHATIRANGRIASEYALLDFDLLRQAVYFRTKGSGSPDSWQPVYTGANYQPEDSEGLGNQIWLKNVSGGTISNNAIVTFSSVNRAYVNASGVVTSTATVLSGSFKLVAGFALQNNFSGLFVKVAL